MAAALAGLEAEGTDLQARGEIGPLDVAMFRRRVMQLEAELRWHDEFVSVITSVPEPDGQAAAKEVKEPGAAASIAAPAASGVETQRKSPSQGQQAVPGRGIKKRRGT